MKTPISLPTTVLLQRGPPVQRTNLRLAQSQGHDLRQASKTAWPVAEWVFESRMTKHAAARSTRQPDADRHCARRSAGGGASADGSCGSSSPRLRDLAAKIRQ